MTESSGGSAVYPSDYSFYDENYKPMWKRGISRKIGESAFVQQTLPTYRLSWNPLKMCPLLLVLGALFTGMGVGMKKFAENVEEVTIPYTNCTSLEYQSTTCYSVLAAYHNKRELTDASDMKNCTCWIHFPIHNPIEGTVFLHYAITDFYQNHRDYYASRDENQLKGNLFDNDGNPREPSGACKPYDRDKDERIIYPCGLMANSMFTDEIQLCYHPMLEEETALKSGDSECHTQQGIEVPLNKTGIAWESDRNDKYKHPEHFDNESHPIWKEKFAKPYGWKKSLWQLDPTNSTNNGVLNEDFIVWMRTAAFPWFRKLHRILDSRIAPFKNGLPAGNYSLRVEYNYDVSSFKGEKSIILTTTSMVAGKNMFLAIVYMTTGALCIFLSIVIFAVYKCTQSRLLKQD